MDRRRFLLTLLAGAVLVVPPAAEAQQERTTFKLHIWPKDAKTWSKKGQEFTSYDDCKSAAWVQKQKGNAATCDTQ